MHKSIHLFEIENHFFYTSNYRQGANTANHIKNDDFLFHKSYILLFAVFGGRGIIRGDFWGQATISHLTYNSKNKQDDFS